MKVQSDIRAGMTYNECDAQRNSYKALVQSGHCTGLLPNPPQPQPYPPYPGPGGGWVDGVWYGDRSGVCG
jgi:hypothetical protein